MVGGDPGVVRVADRRRRHRGGREEIPEGPLRERDRRVGESVAGIDDGGRAVEPDRLRGGVPVHLAAARLRRVGGDPGCAVPLLPVGLRPGQCVRDPLRVAAGGVVGDQDFDDEGA